MIVFFMKFHQKSILKKTEQKFAEIKKMKQLNNSTLQVKSR